jgi:hypothetical protein
VSPIARRFRGVFIAIVVLGLSASAVFAARVVPQVAATLANATTASQPRSEADEDQNEAPDADKDEDGTSADENEAPEATDDQDATDPEDAASDSHGAVVSEAAHMDTPAGFRNHGAFVSCVAHMKDLGANGAVVDWTLITPESCAAAAAATDDETDATDGTDTDTEDTDAEDVSDSHGAIVSEAAHMDTPAGFRNHGAFVSCVAQMPDAAAGAAPLDLAALTPADCGATEPDEADAGTGAAGSTDGDSPKKDKSQKTNHGHGKGHAKHHHS